MFIQLSLIVHSQFKIMKVISDQLMPLLIIGLIDNRKHRQVIMNQSKHGGAAESRGGTLQYNGSNQNLLENEENDQTYIFLENSIQSLSISIDWSSFDCQLLNDGFEPGMEYQSNPTAMSGGGSGGAQAQNQSTLTAPIGQQAQHINRDILNQQMQAIQNAGGTLKTNMAGFIQHQQQHSSDIERYNYGNQMANGKIDEIQKFIGNLSIGRQQQLNQPNGNMVMQQSDAQKHQQRGFQNNNFYQGPSNAISDVVYQQTQAQLKQAQNYAHGGVVGAQSKQYQQKTNQPNQQAPATHTQPNNNYTPNQTCSYHNKGFVAYCMMHKELMCEECCDLSHHKDHNNQILLLKAAAQSFLKDVDFRLSEVLSAQKVSLLKCQDFNLRTLIRRQMIDFFDGLKSQIETMQKQKLDEFNKLIKDTNVINIKQRAKEVAQRADNCEQFLSLKKNQFEAKNYVSFLTEVEELEKQLKTSERLVKEASDLLREQDQQKSIEFIHDREKAENKIKQIIESTLKVPILKYNRDMLDTLHFFVYNTHNLFMYNFRTHSYRSYVVNIKIPANFMSVENEEGRIFLTGGGEPGKATKFCFEFVEERLVQRRDMLFERRAHTLTSVLVEGKKSQIFAIGSSLPNDSMNKCEVYDVASDTWTQIASLGTKRNFHTTIAFDCQSLYVVAGFNGGQRTNLIEKFDLKRRQQWETLNLKIKENTNWICLEGCGLFQISNQHILIFGGFTTSDQKTNHCYLFNVQSNEIEQLNCKTRTQSNFYQRQPKIGTADGKLYCVETNSLDLHIFDMKTFEWDFIDRKQHQQFILNLEKQSERQEAIKLKRLI